MSIFQKRHYEFIAKVIASMPDDYDDFDRTKTLFVFSKAFYNESDKFDHERFADFVDKCVKNNAG